MKIVVATKRVADYNAKVRVRLDSTGVDIANAKTSMNPFDAIERVPELIDAI
ncbi:hypothetical protein [Burkholderia ubonensis]|uniref:hypothetical protein n=1 Tax=Burkholderia ubonensis TaxID=101571 RepID=UPI0039F49FB8